MREGIYIGNKEVVKRYIGNKLVWEKLRLLFSESVTVYYRPQSREIDTGSFSVSENVKAVEINGQQIAISGVRRIYGTTRLKFVDSLDEFERKTGFKRTAHYYESITIKFYGV